MTQQNKSDYTHFIKEFVEQSVSYFFKVTNDYTITLKKESLHLDAKINFTKDTYLRKSNNTKESVIFFLNKYEIFNLFENIVIFSENNVNDKYTVRFIFKNTGYTQGIMEYEIQKILMGDVGNIKIEGKTATGKTTIFKNFEYFLSVKNIKYIKLSKKDFMDNFESLKNLKQAPEYILYDEVRGSEQEDQILSLLDRDFFKNTNVIYTMFPNKTSNYLEKGNNFIISTLNYNRTRFFKPNVDEILPIFTGFKKPIDMVNVKDFKDVQCMNYDYVLIENKTFIVKHSENELDSDDIKKEINDIRELLSSSLDRLDFLYSQL